MSLERNLIVSVFVVLWVSLLAGAALTCGHAASKVRTEINAALTVGQRIVQNAADDSRGQANPNVELARIIASFNGDRHLRAVLIGADDRVSLQSTLRQPEDPAPQLFVDLVSGPTVVADVALPLSLIAKGHLQLRTDAHNEVSEVWADVKLDLLILIMFFCLVLGLVVRTLRGALQPLRKVCTAFTSIGAGDYATRLALGDAKELVDVQDGFNAMAERLAGMELHNRLLQTRMQRVQDEERAELARDLHDEVAPFLFAVSADASLIRQFAGANKIEDIDARADGILTSVNHMQKHLRRVLSRLMPDVLLDLGLAGAIETLVHFWKSRCPGVHFTVYVDADSLDNRRTAVAFRVVQESLSNAVRHGKPNRVGVRVEDTDDGCVIEVVDDGAGLPNQPHQSGLGLLGMRERVTAVGGRFSVDKPVGSRGVAIRALLFHESELME